MNVIGAVRTYCSSVSSGGGWLHRFAPGAIYLASFSVLRVQFAFGLQPMRRLVAVPPTGFFPNLIGTPSDVFVTD
jgi:hypothetical protein